MYKSIDDFIEKQKCLLDLEKKEEQDEWEILLKKCSLKELEKQGLCIRNVQIDEEKTGMFGRYVVTFGYPMDRKKQDSLHSNKFSSGDNVGVYKNKVQVNSLIDASGIVLSSKMKCITIAFEDEFDTSSPYYQLVMLPNDVTFRRLKRVLQSMSGLSSELKLSNLLYIQSLIPFKPQNKPINSLKPFVFFNNDLDDSQKEAVTFVLSTNEIISIIHGPPGTGKTTTIVEVIRQAQQDKKKILVCAPSNIAVDNLVEKLSLCSISIVRLGHPARASTKLHRYCLDAMLLNHDSSEVIMDARKDVKNVLNDMRNCKNKQERIMLRNDLKLLKKEVNEREKKAMKDILKGVDVVLSTTNSATFESGPLRRLEENHFDLLVIDEAAQALEVSCWIPLLHVSKCILAGDHQQLPPTIKSDEASKKGLSTTLMERIIKEGKECNVAMLTKQYRMNESIMLWSSQQFYNNKLEASQSVCNHTLKDLNGVENNEITEAPIVFVDTAGCDMFEAAQSDSTSSKSNEHEVSIISEHVDKLVSSGVNGQSIGIITPYNQQVEMLKKVIRENHPQVEINSVDGFQGREKEAILISMVRSNPDREVGFLSDYRRINVAITRARRHLFIVADSATISSHSILASFCNYLYKNSLVKSPETNNTLNKENDKELMKKVESFFKQEQHLNKPFESRQKNSPHIKNDTTSAQLQTNKVVTEKADISFGHAIEQFILSDDNEYTFSTSLTSKDRALVHEIAEQYGLIHESHGDGKQRYIILRKIDEKIDGNDADLKMKEMSIDEPIRVDTIKESTNTPSCSSGNTTKENVASSVKKKSQTKKKNDKKKKTKKTDTDGDNDDDDIDSFLFSAVSQNNKCFYHKCSTKTQTLGQNCQFCFQRFCIGHYVAEMHGCGAAAALHAKKQIGRINNIHAKPMSDNKRGVAQKKLQKAISDMEAKRKNIKKK